MCIATSRLRRSWHESVTERELPPELGIRMKIAVSTSVEPDVAERHVQGLLRRLVRHHDIEVKRGVCARGMNRGAGPADQDRRAAVPIQSCPCDESHLPEGRLRDTVADPVR
jgi:hypothetical protein